MKMKKNYIKVLLKKILCIKEKFLITYPLYFLSLYPVSRIIL